MFWWITSWVLHDADRAIKLRWFQSLFWWITSWVSHGLKLFRCYRNSFNPCSGGSHPGSAGRAHPGPRHGGVSILVLVDHILGPDLVAQLNQLNSVSILVLVDHILGHVPEGKGVGA